MTIQQSNSCSFVDAFRGYLLAQQARNVVPRYVAMLERTRDYVVKRLGNLALSDITPDHVRRWLLWLQGHDEDPDAPIPPHNQRNGGPISGAYVDINFRNLKAFFHWCEDEELIAHSPMRKVKRPRYDQTLPDALTEHEALTLLDRVKANGDRNAFRDYCIHLMFMDTGVRLAELVHLNADGLHLDEGYAKVMGKGRRERIVPLGLELRRELSRYLLRHRKPATGETALFVNEYGFRLEGGGIRSVVVRDLKHYVPRKLSKCGPHTLRHTFATFNLRYTRDMKATSMILGHTTTRTTERYLHLTGADVLRNAEGSPMDAILRGGNGHL